MKKFISVLIVLCLIFSVMPIVLVNADVKGHWEYSASAEFITIEKYNGSDINVTIPDRINNNEVVAIASNAFSGNTKIKSVTIPNTVRYIYNNAFYGCENLATIKAPNGLTIGKQVFDGTAFYNDENNWKDGILYFYDSVIKAKNDIKTVSFIEDVHAICPEAFKDCDNLTSVTIPSTVYIVDENAFDGCSNLKEVVFERKIIEGLTINIGKEAFLNCESLKSVKIPENVSSVSSNSFGFSYNVDFVKNENFVIYGAKETVAEDYAISNDFKFVVYDFENGVVDAENCEHTTEMKNQKASTYFAKGYTGDSICTVCNTVVVNGKEVAKLKLKVPNFKLSGGKKKFTVKYTNVKDATGFEIKYKLKNSKFKTLKVDSKKSISKVVKNLKKGKYTVLIRAFIKNGNKKAYSNWSKSKTVTVK